MPVPERWVKDVEACRRSRSPLGDRLITCCEELWEAENAAQESTATLKRIADCIVTAVHGKELTSAVAKED